MVHKQTIENVTRAYPRQKWSGCFAATIHEEIGLKPWSHTTVIDRFAEQVEGNKLMEPYE
jgi:cyanamide hydratase